MSSPLPTGIFGLSEGHSFALVAIAGAPWVIFTGGPGGIIGLPMALLATWVASEHGLIFGYAIAIGQYVAIGLVITIAANLREIVEGLGSLIASLCECLWVLVVFILVDVPKFIGKEIYRIWTRKSRQQKYIPQSGVSRDSVFKAIGKVIASIISAIVIFPVAAPFFIIRDSLKFLLKINQQKSKVVPPQHQAQAQPQPTPQPQARPQQQSQPVTLYHGTSTREWADDIYFNRRFKIGASKPASVWFTPNYRYAAGRTGSSGAVVEFRRDMNSTLTEKVVGGDRHYIALAPKEEDYSRTYFKVPGMTPVAMYDSQGNKLF